MIRQHEGRNSVTLECTNCRKTWVIRYPTEQQLDKSATRHFKNCHVPDPKPLPKKPREFNLPVYRPEPLPTAIHDPWRTL